jgi:hypothetical protein
MAVKKTPQTAKTPDASHSLFFKYPQGVTLA